MLPPGNTVILLYNGGKRVATKARCRCQVCILSLTLALKCSLLTPTFGPPKQNKRALRKFFGEQLMSHERTMREDVNAVEEAN